MDKKHKAENQPLTYSELEKMTGCPVWVEADHAFIQYSGWALIDKIQDDDPDFTGIKFTCPDRSEIFLLADFIGKTWNAYRKPYRKSRKKAEEKPAPCGCGGKAYIYKCEADISKPWTLMCENCGIMTKPYPTKSAAVKAWNKSMGADQCQ